MRPLRGDECWAAAIIRAALGVPVHLHDDGSAPGMYDLRIDQPQGPAAAEVIACIDAEAVEAWKLISKRGGFLTLDGLSRQWTVRILPTARVKELHQLLSTKLSSLEQGGQYTWECDERPSNEGVVTASATKGGTPGKVYLPLHRPADLTSGWAPSTGNPLARWIGGWLGEPERRDVLAKLAQSGLGERHVFVFVYGFSTAPFDVQYLLMEDHPALPVRQPELPAEVTHAWLASTWDTPRGVRWDPQDGWRRFEKVTTIPPD